MPIPPSWSGFQIAQLIVSSLTPIVVAIIGFIFNRSIKRLDKRQWTNQKILEKRLIIYDKVVPMLNDIFCFHCYVGNCKNIATGDIVNNKRVLDKEMNVYSPVFGGDVINKYNNFIDAYYETNTGWGNDAKIKSLYSMREQYSNVWKKSDIILFFEKYIKLASKNNNSENIFISEKKKAYFELVNSISSSLEIMQSNVNASIENPSINFCHR